MKPMNTMKPNRFQSTPSLWTPLSECQQELLSGGAPKVNGGSSGSGSGGSTGSAVITTITNLLSSLDI